jgi:hypothetical protein
VLMNTRGTREVMMILRNMKNLKVRWINVLHNCSFDHLLSSLNFFYACMLVLQAWHMCAPFVCQTDMATCHGICYSRYALCRKNNRL